jgi:hypothetical protein
MKCAWARVTAAVRVTPRAEARHALLSSGSSHAGVACRVRRGVYQNNLNGTLPDAIGGLTSMTRLCVRCACGGLLEGADAECTRMPVVRRRNIQINKISGTIPASLGNMNLMKDFRVRV